MTDDSVSTQLDQVEAMIQSGRRTEALQLLQQLCKTAPNNIDVWWLTAQVLEKPDNQRRALVEVLRINPQHEEALSQLQALNPPRRVVGVDGELSVPLPVELLKLKTPSRSGSGLTMRLILIVVALIVVFGGAALVALYVNAVNSNVSQEPSIARIPARFSAGPYNVNFNLDTRTGATVPCTVRKFTVTVNGNAQNRVRLWSWPEHGGIELASSLDSSKRTTVFEVPADKADVVNIWVYNGIGEQVADVEDITIGNKDFPICELQMIFTPIGG